MSLSQRPQQAPSPARPQDLTLTSFLSCLPTAVHSHNLLALLPKQTSHAPLCCPSHDSISAPYLNTSPLEICLCPSPPICSPYRVISHNTSLTMSFCYLISDRSPLPLDQVPQLSQACLSSHFPLRAGHGSLPWHTLSFN